MKAFPDKSSKSYLVWLVSLTLLFSLGMGAVSGSTAPLRNLKQTEQILSSDQKVIKGIHFLTLFLTKHTSPFIYHSSFCSLISWHTHAAILKLKISDQHLISPTPKIGHLQSKISQSTDEDSSILKG
jgi:hypothetical protein